MASVSVQNIQDLRLQISAAASGRKFSGGLYLTAPWLPTALIVATAAAAVGTSGIGAWTAVEYGFIGGLILWSIAAGLVSSTIDAARANPVQFNAIHARLTELQARLNAHPNNSSRHANEARAAFNAAEQLLEDSDPRPWVLGSGYNEIWKRLHQVSQKLSYFEDPQDVEAAIKRVRARLDESTIESKKDRIKELDDVLKGGGPSRKAPTILGNAAKIVDEYRDSRWDKVIDLRQDVRFYTGVLGAVAYLAFALVVVHGIPTSAVFAATAYLIVGALVGLISRSESREATAATVEDFGLDRARTGLAVLVAGIVAVLSVGIASMLTTMSFTALVQPPGPNGAAAFDLAAVYDLAKYPGGVVIAAIFGLSPKLFLSRLSDATETLKKQIQSTEASEGVK